MIASTFSAVAPPPREEIRTVAEQVFDRAEFARRKGVLQRVIDWFTNLFPERSVSKGGYSAASNLLLYVALALLLVLVVWLIVRVVRGRVRRAPRDEPEGPTVSIEVPRSTADWRSEAERLEAEGRWKDAMLARYRQLVGTLVDGGVLSREPGRTTGELRAELSLAVPAAAGWFDEATSMFERPWYADLPTGPDESRRFAELAALVIEAAAAEGQPDEPTNDPTSPDGMVPA